MDELDKIKRLTDNYSDVEVEALGAPFLLRTFVFLLKEFPRCFREEKFDGINHNFIFFGSRRIKFKFLADEFSCGRYIINKNSKLFVENKNDSRLVGFKDFKNLFYLINQGKSNDVKSINITSQINKLKQQTRYFIFISTCAQLAKNKLAEHYLNEKKIYQKIIFNHNRRNLAFLLMDSFGVVNGHLDHPTPYPYSDFLDINLLGNDPFLSFLYIMDDMILLDDEKFAKGGMHLFSKNGTRKNINGLDLALLPKEIFKEDSFGELSRLSSIFFRTFKNFFDKSFLYDTKKYFLLPIPMIEKKLILASSEKTSLLDNIIFSNCPLLAVSTSSGRSMIVPVSNSKNDNLLYIKTSWPDVIKTSLNRGLSPSKIQWFKICNQIYGNFKNKYFYYLTESHYIPLDVKNNHFAFIERDYEPILRRKRNEFVLPLIGLVAPNHPFLGDKTAIGYLASVNGEKKFVKEIIKCITNTLIFQLLDKGVFHGLHLQNCCILFSKNGRHILPKKVVIRDGDIRICKDYLGLLSEEELNLVNGLTRKRGKINSKSKFYKYFFHNIINENFGNIEQCLAENKDFDSFIFWKIVYECFIESIKENIKILKKEGRFDIARSTIVDDFKRMVFGRSGYSANFFEMEYLGKDEGFIKVSNPFKTYKII